MSPEYTEALKIMLSGYASLILVVPFLVHAHLRSKATPRTMKAVQEREKQEAKAVELAEHAKRLYGRIVC